MSCEYFTRTSLYLVSLKIFKWIKFVRRHLHQIQWVGRNFITASRENSRLITHARMRRKFLFVWGLVWGGWYSLLRRNYISKFWAKHSFYDPTLQKCCSGFRWCFVLSFRRYRNWATLKNVRYHAQLESSSRPPQSPSCNVPGFFRATSSYAYYFVLANCSF